MRHQQNMVNTFHQVMQLDQDGKGGTKTEWKKIEHDETIDFADQMILFAERLQEHNYYDDVQLCRIAFMIEELAEHILAETEVEAADGITDLHYVSLGTCDVYSWPSEELFNEVHRSNMTKKRPEGTLKLEDKGIEYEPPKIAQVLAAHRQKDYKKTDLSMQARKERKEARKAAE